jgi:hypothetical protein
MALRCDPPTLAFLPFPHYVVLNLDLIPPTRKEAAMLFPRAFSVGAFLTLIPLVSFGSGNTSPVVSVMNVTGDWEARGDLPRQALLISLQGIANKHGANVYLVYPPEHQHPGSAAILEFDRKRHGLMTRSITSIDEAVTLYQKYLKGCVVWDTAVTTSLMVSFTVAGLEDALVVTEAQLPLMESLGIKPVADFRAKFRGKTDLEVFQWAYDQYWAKCSRDYLVYLGEHCRGLKGGPGMRPAVADFAIAHRAFCTDLSTMPAAGGEYALANRIFSEMHPYAYIFGWHSYCKDKEEEHITLMSRYALVVAEGLASVPNLSFHGALPVSPDFQFKQKGKFNPNPGIEKKVYLALIESDGLGIGSWLKSGRGNIPYGWEMNEEYFGVAPSLLQYYYETATPNDHFIGSLSGPGYFYPKAYPRDKLPGVLRIEDTLMRKLDLHVFAIMDFSEGDHVVGNADLPKRVVDAYFENIPSAMGFLNGYGPANTFDHRNGRALLSYDYYVDKQKTAAEVAEDLRELARINPARPYFLPVHVREDNDVQRMIDVIKQLGEEFEVVSPEEFMIMAGKQPTMTVRYLDEKPDFSGRWKLVRAQSRNVFPTSTELVIDQRGKHITMTTTAKEARYIHHRELTTTKSMIIGGPGVPSAEEMTRRMGFSGGWSDSIVSAASWKEDGVTLRVTTALSLQTSQGSFPSTSISDYTLSDDRMTLTVNERRSTRKTDMPAVVYVYSRVL